MPRTLSPERRKLVVLCGAVAATSAAAMPYLHAHHGLAVVWMVIEAGAIGYALWKMTQLRRSGKWC